MSRAPNSLQCSSGFKGGYQMLSADYLRRRSKRAIWQYGLAVISVAAALVITSPMESYTDVTPLFYAAIIITAWFGGMGPGILAVVLASLAIDYYLVPPLYTLRIEVKHVSFLIVFGCLAILTSWMSTKRKQAE